MFLLLLAHTDQTIIKQYTHVWSRPKAQCPQQRTHESAK